ncbi:MAG: hypothetical protein ACM3MI_04300 [Clostridiales bacterium]
MKKIVLILIFLSLSFSSTFSQHYMGYAQRMFLYQQPNARAEALGRGQVTLHDSPFSMFDNPAAPAFSNGLNVELTHMDPNYPFKTYGFYNTYGITYNMGKYGRIGFNYLSFSIGDADKTYDVPVADGDYSDYNFNRIYMLNYSRQVFHDFSVGISLDYFYDKLSDIYNIKRVRAYDTYYFDLGLLKRFSFNQSGGNDLYLGLSLTNAGYSEAKGQFFNEQFPTIMHLGASYELQIINKDYYGFPPLKLLLCGEYMDVFETRYLSQIRLGAEATLWEMLKLRLGHWSETLEADFNESMRTKLSQFTYGVGVELPMKRFSKSFLPLTFSLDFTYLPLPDYDDFSYIDPFSDLFFTDSGFSKYNKSYYIISLNVKVGI